jgi:hypothetical protein
VRRAASAWTTTTLIAWETTSCNSRAIRARSAVSASAVRRTISVRWARLRYTQAPASHGTVKTSNVPKKSSGRTAPSSRKGLASTAAALPPSATVARAGAEVAATV